jgi:hypothetical protein
MELLGMTQKKRKKLFSGEFVAGSVLALVNLALDQADIRVMFASWLSMAACIGLLSDAVRRSGWAGTAGLKRLVATYATIAIGFVGFGIYLQIRENDAERTRETAKHPIRVDDVTVNADRMPGQSIRLVIDITNLSGRTLRTKGIGLPVFTMLPKTSFDRERLEDELWARELMALDSSAVERDLPSDIADGELNLKRYAKLTDFQSQEIMKGDAVVYFMEIIQDVETNENLVEFCGFTGLVPSVTECYKHNLP